MASPKTVNEAMSKADSLDSAHWLASSTAGFKTNSSFQKRSHAGSGSGASGAGSSSYAPMDLGNILLNALKEAGVQGMPQRPQRPQQAQDASKNQMLCVRRIWTHEEGLPKAEDEDLDDRWACS